MYNTYAAKCGFYPRLGTIKRFKGVITHRYITCSKAGKPKLQDFDSMETSSITTSRRSSYTVTNCKARIKLSAIFGTPKFHLYGFVETHNHCLVDTNNIEFTQQRRKISYSDYQFIHKLSLNNIGPSIAHKLQCSLKGGHHNVHGTKTDYKNTSRDIRLFIGDRYGQMIVDTLNSRATNLNNFFFEFTFVGTELRSLFWADDVSKCNYEAFGDVLAFDATYHTNM